MTQNDVYHKINDVTNVPVYSRSKQDYMNFFLQATLSMYLKLAFKIGAILSQKYKDMTLYPQMYQNVHGNLLQKTQVYRNRLYISVCNSKNIVFMFGAILKATNSSFQKGMTFCRSIYVKKVKKLLAFIFEQPSYLMSVGQFG